MKRLLTTVTMFLFLFTGVVFASAQSQKVNDHDSKGSEQAKDQLMLSLFNEHIDKAVANYYKDDSISFQYNWWDKDYDVVEVDQSEKGHVLKSPFEVTFTVEPIKTKQDKQTNTITLGPKVGGADTITFGVVPGDVKKEIKVNMLNYKHHDSKEK